MVVPQIIQVMDGHSSIETAMVAWGIPHLKKPPSEYCSLPMSHGLVTFCSPVELR